MIRAHRHPQTESRDVDELIAVDGAVRSRRPFTARAPGGPHDA
jgi:hypothetical protein